MISLINGQKSTLCSNYSVIRTYLRDGAPPQQVKKRGYYMVDSTYTVPSDPNTMRDTGFLRNVVYRLEDKVDKEYLKRNNPNGATFTKYMNEMDKLKETLKQRCPHQRRQSTNANGSRYLNKTMMQTTKPAKVIDDLVVVARNDYTKNLSAFIFNPAVKKQRPSTATIAPTKISSGSSSHIGKVAKKSSPIKGIEKEIISEKERRSRLERDVQMLKEQILKIQESVKSGSSK